MITLTVDNTPVTVAPGTTIMAAAAQAGITVPSLCRYEGIEPPTSCFVCVVKVRGRAGFVPACVASAEDGMVVENSSDEVALARRRALELLISEHAGDCEAPCRRVCACDMDIPEMIRRVYRGDLRGAAQTVRTHMPFPGILGKVCPAPCQKGCRRAQVDSTVAIRNLHLQVALTDLSSGKPWLPTPAPATGRRVAVVGAGPAGMAAAWFVRCAGHACAVYDARDCAGGMLRFGVNRENLPEELLERELALLDRLGVAFVMRTALGTDISLDELLEAHDAVILAIGQPDAAFLEKVGLEGRSQGVAVDRGTYQSSRRGVFACGGAIIPGRLAVRSMGQGRTVALIVDAMLRSGGEAAPLAREFDCRLGAVDRNELAALAHTTVESHSKRGEGSFDSQTADQAGRCLSCDCTVKHDCGLRQLCQEYEASQQQYRGGARREVVQRCASSEVVYEQGKCIKCGRCVAIVEKARVRPGVCFVERGFAASVEAPFGASVPDALGDKARECVAACPTGALYVVNHGEDQ